MLLLASTAVAVLAPGCMSTSKGKRMPNAITYAPPMAEAPIVQSVGVAIADDRPKGQTFESNEMKKLLLLIPGVPYVTLKTRLFGTDLPEDVQAAIVKDLKAAGIVAEATKGADAGNCLIDVRVTEGVWTRKYTTYGLLFFGSILHYAGAPDSYGSGDLAFDVTILSPAGNEIGRKSFAAKTPFTNWIYSSDAPKTLRSRVIDRLVADYETISPDLRQFVLETLQVAH